MYKITEKVALNPTVTKMVIEAPLIAKKAKPGQFIIVRPFEDSERIPLTVAGYDREKGTVDIIFQIVGGTTMELNSLNAGDCVHDFVGPLGRATETEGLKKVCVVGGGVGCAIALPIAKELHDQGCVAGAGGYGFSLVFSLIIRSACGCSPGTYGTTFLTYDSQFSIPFLLLFQSVHCRQLRKCRQGMFHGLMGHTVRQTHESRTAESTSLYHQKIKFLSLVYEFFLVFHR